MWMQLAIGSLLLSICGAAARAGGETRNHKEDVFCGPRCVKFAAEYFGRPEETLFAIVREIQWPRVEEGISLEQIASALRRRGVEATVVKVSNTQELQVACPAILHLPREGRLGHFVVLLRSDREWCTLWDGTSGMLTQPVETIQRQASGLAVAFGRPVPRIDESVINHGLLAQVIVLLNVLLAIFVWKHTQRKSL